ncbi:hypothetical protein BH23PLA1_BH23PLA1_17120 [soil metagenome]
MMRRSLGTAAMLFGLLFWIGCDNPESRQAGEAIQDAAVKSGAAIEASTEESRQAVGEALEDAGQSMQPANEP